MNWIFFILAIPIILISRENVFHPTSHGFPRLLGWLGIAWLFSVNYSFWIVEPLAPIQLISWLFLVLSAYLVIAALIDFRRFGKNNAQRNDKHLFDFEKTANLIDQGIYKFIRHPMYASLLALTWGIALKNPEWIVLIVSVFCSIMFYLTARLDEKECIQFFGESYKQYKTRSRMFIPFIF